MPENGIFVFDTRANARNFRRSFVFPERNRILKVTVSGEEMPVTMYDFVALTHGEKKPDIDPIPKGTKAFPSVTPVAEVH
jgi:hypothetical protein